MPDLLQTARAGVGGRVGGATVGNSSILTVASARAGLAVLVTVVVAAYLWLFLRAVWRIGDEGSIVYGAQRVTEGQVPYRDFFEVMGPGAFYWLALWFEVLGVSWATSRTAILTTALVSAWAIYIISSRLCPPRIALLPAAFYTVLTVPLWPGANHHFDSNMWVLLALAVLVSAREVSAKRGALAGILLGFSSTIMPQKGVLVLLALALDAVVQGWASSSWWPALRRIMAMTGALASVGVTVVLWFWSQGALGDLWYAMAVWPASQYHTVNVVPYAHGMTELFLPFWASVFSVLLPVPLSTAAAGVSIIPLAFVASLPVLVLTGTALTFMRSRLRGGALRGMSFTCALTSLGLFVSECHRPDLMHLIYGSPLLLVVACSWLGVSRSRLVAGTRHALVGSLMALAGLLAFIASTADARVDTRRGAVSMFGEDKALMFLQDNVAFGQSAFVYPYYPMYYFLGGVQNPTRYSILMYHINTRAQFEEVVRTLESERTGYVLWDTLVADDNLSRWFPRYTHPPEGEQILEQYLRAKYHLVSIRNGFRILQRLDDSPLAQAPDGSLLLRSPVDIVAEPDHRDLEE